MKYTKESENLQSFVDSTLRHIPIENLNKNSQNELRQMYQYMHDGNNEYKSAKCYKNNSAKSDTSNVPDAIKPHLARCTHTAATTFKVNGRTIYLMICSPHPIHNFTQYVKRIYIWLYIASKYASTQCSETININIYLTAHVKLLPLNGHTIGRINVNTAYTTPCASSTDICIYREQEWFKVFIHETFHNLGLDFSKMRITAADTHIQKMFKINADISLYETYCETWAEIIHCQFLTFFSTHIKTNYDMMMAKLDRMLETEARFSLFQSTKVLDHNNMVYTDMFNESKRRNYREDTHVLSYYIIKALLLYNKNKFIGWCSSNNKVLLDFNKTAHGIDSFCSLIRSVYMDPVYINLKRSIEPWFIYNKLSGTFVRKTLRMTVMELEN
jgi:hypothetical protein